MFKNVIHIISVLIIVSVFISCAGESKNDSVASGTMIEEDLSAEPNPVELTIKELPDSLTEKQQKAYQLRAKQKFQDFIDYIEILSDKKVDIDLKQHSYKLAMDLFLNDSTTIIINKEKKINVQLKEYLSLLMMNQKKSERFDYKNIQFTENLKRDSLSKYYGTITFQTKPYNGNLFSTVDVYLIETKKQFGSSVEKTIEIKLGNIY